MLPRPLLSRVLTVFHPLALVTQERGEAHRNKRRTAFSLAVPLQNTGAA